MGEPSYTRYLETSKEELRAEVERLRAEAKREFDIATGYHARWQDAEARLARVVDLATLKIEYAADDQAGGWNAAMEAVLAAAQPEEEP